MRSHAALNSIVVMMLLSGVSTTVRPAAAERCQTGPGNGPGCKQPCSLGSFVQNMVQHINTCLNHTTTWTVTGNNPIILIPQTNNGTQGAKKTFCWRQLDIVPPVQTKNVIRIRCTPRQINADKNPPNAKSVKQVGQKQGNTGNHHQSVSDRREGSKDGPRIKEDGTKTTSVQGASEKHDSRSSEEANINYKTDETKTTPQPQPSEMNLSSSDGQTHNHHHQTRSDVQGSLTTLIQGNETKTTTSPNEHETPATEMLCIPGGDILLYNPHCKSSSSRDHKTHTGEMDENVKVLKCSTDVEGICPGMTVLNCLACIRAESEHAEGNVHALNNSKYSDNSTKITISGHNDHEMPLTETQLDQLRRLRLQCDVNSLIQSKEKPMVVHVEDKSSNKMSKYVIVEKTGNMMVGIPCDDLEEPPTTTTTTTHPTTRATTTSTTHPTTRATTTTTTHPTTRTTTTTTTPPTTNTFNPRQTTKKGTHRNSFIDRTRGLIGEPLLVRCIEPSLYGPPEELAGRQLFLHCFEPLTNIPQEPLLSNFRQVVPSITDPLFFNRRPSAADMSSTGARHHHSTAEIPKNTQQSDQFEKNQAVAECSFLYNHGHSRNFQHNTNRWSAEEVQPDCEDYQDDEGFENEAASSNKFSNVRQCPQSYWNTNSNSHSTANAQKPLKNYYKETPNWRHNSAKQVHINPSPGDQYQKPKMNPAPYHHQQANSGHRIYDRAPDDCMPAQQKPGRFQPARIPVYLRKPPQIYKSATGGTHYQANDPYQNNKGITPNYHPNNNNKGNRGHVQGIGTQMLVQQKPERFQPARTPEYLPKPPHIYSSATGDTYYQNSGPYPNRKGISPYYHPKNNNRGSVQGTGSQIPRVPTDHQGQPTWGNNRPMPNNRVYGGIIPEQPPGRYYQSYNQRVLPRTTAGYSNTICEFNPLQRMMQVPIGYTVPPSIVC